MPPALDVLITACAIDNARFESDIQTKALRYGWKVRKWVGEQGIAYRVPVYYAAERVWYLLDAVGGRTAISHARARGLMVEVYGDEYDEWEASVA